MVIAHERAAGECSKAIDTGVERGGSHLRLTLEQRAIPVGRAFVAAPGSSSGSS